MLAILIETRAGPLSEHTLMTMTFINYVNEFYLIKHYNNKVNKNMIPNRFY